MKEIIIVYERGQIDAIEQYVKERASNVLVIALNYWVEQDMRARGITVSPLTDYCKPWVHAPDIVWKAETIARQWYRLPELSFFQYKNLSLGEMLEGIIGDYLKEVQSYLYFFERVFDKHSEVQRLTIPYSTVSMAATTGPFSPFQMQVVVATGKAYAQHRNVAFRTFGPAPATSVTLFPQQPFFRTIFLRVYNFIIGTLAPRRPLRLLVSNNWRYIKPIVEAMNDTELIIVDRREFKNIPWRQLWKHRIRFIHPLDVVTSRMRAIARVQQQKWGKAWHAAKEAVGSLPDFIRGDFNWWPVVEPAFSAFVGTYAERIIADTESIQAMLEKERINRVLVRTSVSGQHHFYILGELPRTLGIPSFEIQHGIGVGILDPHSVFGQLHADYLAAYGPFVRQAFVRNGYAAERIRPTGSPRFDRYVIERNALTPSERNQKLIAMGLDSRRPVIFVAMPVEVEFTLGSTDLLSYEFRDFIQSLKKVKEAFPEIQYILKFRSAASCEKYKSCISEILSDDIIFRHDDAFPLVLLSDFVYACFSTMVSECIMARKPVILFPLKRVDTYFYEAHKDGVIPTLLIDEKSGIPTGEVIEITKKLINDKIFYADAVKRGERYLAENFTFAENTTQNVVDLLRTITLPPDR